MSEVLAQLEKKGGGAMSETVLWTNPSPTSDFADNTITLSDNITKYNYIKVIFKTTKSSSTYFDVMMSVENFVQTSVANANSYALSGYYRNSGNGPYCRPVGYVSNTSLRMRYANSMNGVATDNALLIPYQIIGLK